jgi:hypothetical protein
VTALRALKLSPDRDQLRFVRKVVDINDSAEATIRIHAPSPYRPHAVLAHRAKRHENAVIKKEPSAQIRLCSAPPSAAAGAAPDAESAIAKAIKEW